MPILLALAGVWNHNFLGMDSQAVIPYCERLRLFVDHLQQMDMESNGKSATADGDTVDTDTGPIIWGQTGTNGQHAFFQLLHQGTRPTPVDFIGCIEDTLSQPEHHRLLLANMIAQSEALMLGRSSDDAHRHYPGNRPSTTLLLDRLEPATLGALVALYEHKVFAQAAIWQINPFDQWGVELGKELATEILTGDAEHDPSTRALLKKTGLSR
jgi:glucose-6-phosphate isomerase